MPAAVTKTTALYETLNLQPDATDDEVRVAYKKLVSWRASCNMLINDAVSYAVKWHPDRCQEHT